MSRPRGGRIVKRGGARGVRGRMVRGVARRQGGAGHRGRGAKVGAGGGRKVGGRGRGRGKKTPVPSKDALDKEMDTFMQER